MRRCRSSSTRRLDDLALIPSARRTINYDLPVTGAGADLPSTGLGTHDQGRDVLARLISASASRSLFGLTLTVFSVATASPPARCRAISAAHRISLMRASGAVSNLPQLLHADHLEHRAAEFLVAARPSCCFRVDCSLAMSAREYPAPRNFDYGPRRAALGRLDLFIMVRHVLPNAMVSDPDLPAFIMSG